MLDTAMPATPAQPLRVLHVISSVDPRWGGTTTQLIALVAAQVKAGMAVTVAATYASDFIPTAANAMRAAGATVVLIGPQWPVLAWHETIAPVLRREIGRAEVVHIHALWEEIQHRAAALCRRLRVPYVVSSHGMLDPWSMAQSALKKKLYMALRLRRDLEGAAALHFTDDAERQAVAPLKLRTPIVVQPIALDFAPFDTLPPAGTFRRLFPAVGDAPYLLFLSRLHHKKGLDLLLPAFARAETAGVKLVIAGPPVTDEYLQQLKATVVRLSLSDRVIFTGMLDGEPKRAAYAEARAFVLPSYQENFGLVIVEALACGTPVLISEGVAIHRHITAARVGEAVPLDEARWADTLSRWLPDESKCRAAGARGAAWVRATYDPAATARAWEGHYWKLIG